MTRREFTSSLGAAFAPPKQRWVVGANTAITGFGLHQAIEVLAGLDLGQIEIHPMGRPEPTPGKFPGFEWDKLDPSERKKLKRALKPFRHITAHLPYTGLDWMSKDDARRASSILTVETALRGSAELGSSLCVLHLQPCADSELEAKWNPLLDRVRVWADLARKSGTKLAIETMFPRSVRDFVRFVKEVDHASVGCTIDVGHQSKYAELVARVKPEERATPDGIRAYNDTTLAIVNGLGSKVWHYHVHDVDPATWVEHKPLVHGFVDYTRLYDAMRANGYKGYLLLEIGGPAAEMRGHLATAKNKLDGWM